MSYTKEMCLYLLDNPDTIEVESLTESVERQIFQAMNKAISMRVGDRTPWRGQYALVTGDDEEHEETWFACAHWPYKANGDPLVCFRLWENEGDNGYWLSQALGMNGGSMCFEFRMVGKTGGPSLYKVKKAMKEFYEQNARLKEAGFKLHQRGSIFMPFTLVPGEVKKEFPDLKMSLAPMKAVLEKLFELKPEFDKLVKAVYPPKQ